MALLLVGDDRALEEKHRRRNCKNVHNRSQLNNMFAMKHFNLLSSNGAADLAVGILGDCLVVHDGPYPFIAERNPLWHNFGRKLPINQISDFCVAPTSLARGQHVLSFLP